MSTEVRSIFSDKCYQCHGPDEASRQTPLRLDDPQTWSQVLDSGRPAVTKNSLEQSDIYRRIMLSDDEEQMPPPESNKRLSQAEREAIRDWILAGAPWGIHWSFEVPRRPTLPSVRNRSWPVNAIDYFVLAELERRGHEPAVLADPRTLARRASLTLTGLPPSLHDLHAYLKDDDANAAYERLVEQLLQSPRYGEHQARYWLDAARYGDTHGLHLDNERSIWRYRDWVIEAFNRNVPFDQFTIEQLAGDLLPNPTLDQRIATGFHRCNVTTSEGGAIAEEFLARYAVDRVETTATVWMGLTAGCASCHDHKFDPISQKEFYQLYAYFYNLTEKAMDGNALLPPPSIKAPTRLQLLQQGKLHSRRNRIGAELEALRTQAKANRLVWEPQLARQRNTTTPPQDARLHLHFEGELGESIKREGNVESAPGKFGQAASFDGQGSLRFDALGNFERSDAFSYGGWVNVTDYSASAILSKMHDDQAFRGYDLYLGGGKVFVHLIHQWEGNAIRVNTKLPLRKEKWQHVFVTYDGSSKARGVRVYVDGREQELQVTHDSLTGSIRCDRPLRIGRRDAGAAYRGMLDDIYLFDRVLLPAEIAQLADSDPIGAILAKSVEQRSPSEDLQLVDVFLRSEDARARAWFAAQQEVATKIARLESDFPSTLVMQERAERRQARVLQRGQYDQPGEPVTAGVPAVLPPTNAKQESRLTLARWLVSREHPLTARVIANRIWQQHFGIGLVETAEDFGAQGQAPSHPELLDYLAVEFMESGWDLQHLHRLIVSSATFRQSSHARPTLEDPQNRLVGRGPRFRLDAEVLRDTALDVSRLLIGTIGGPSVKPYQPEGLWEVVGYPTSTTARFRRDGGAKLYRRGLYTFWKRTSPPPSMQILDAPTREVCTVRRPRTNTPAAALLLMNDVQFVEAARKFAERILAHAEGEDERFAFAYEVATSRLPNERERRILKALLDDALTLYAESPRLAHLLLAHGEAPISTAFPEPEIAAWTMIASTILNLDETINQH